MADKAVRVAVRVRPLLPHEAGHSTETLTVEDNHVRLSGKSFGFDHVFGAESNQVCVPVGGRNGWLTSLNGQSVCWRRAVFVILEVANSLGSPSRHIEGCGVEGLLSLCLCVSCH